MPDPIQPGDYSSLLGCLSDEQRSAVLSTARITVVPACPGSGKTRVFAARFAYESMRHRGDKGGIAALSFTRVAEREIRERLAVGGIVGGHPHFVGTIDKFLIRHVIRTFAVRQVNLRYFERPFAPEERVIQLAGVPGSPHGKSLSEHRLLRVSGSIVCDLDREAITNRHRINTIIQAKKDAWQLGHLTHDDVCFLSAYLLEKAEIRTVLLKRFTTLLIDEFQDTGGSRSSAMFSLLADPALNRALVVGDPDQCIMEFTGASPQLFEDALALDGAVQKHLSTTQRFHKGIVDVVATFAKELGGLQARDDAFARPRSTILLTHTYGVLPADLSSVPRAVQHFHNSEFEGSLENVALLAWSGSTAARLRGGRRRADPDFGCQWLTSLFIGLKCWQQNDAIGLFRRVSQIMVEAGGFYGTEPCRAELQERGLDEREWKRAVWRLAQSAVVPASDNETLIEWIERLKTQMTAGFVQCGLDATTIPHRIKLQAKKLKEAGTSSLTTLLDEACEVPATDILVEKVHQVKGKEFDMVCYFVPTPRTSDVPVRIAWFGPVGTEESRVAFVAMTRAKQALMVMIPKVWEDELSSFPQGRQFMQAFSYRGSLESYLKATDFPGKTIDTHPVLDLLPPTAPL